MHSAFDVLYGIISFGERQAKTIALNRPSAYIPKLRDVLQAEVQIGTCGLDKPNGGGNSEMVRIVLPIDPKKMFVSIRKESGEAINRDPGKCSLA